VTCCQRRTSCDLPTKRWPQSKERTSEQRVQDARYRIPVATLRDWKEGRGEPDEAARACLMVIAREPEMVRKALEPRPLSKSAA
jgi:hypothetical protein